MDKFETKILERVEEFRKYHNTAVLTIMFTDIKGFTEYTDKFGEAKSKELRKLHDEIIINAIEGDKKGLIVKQIGDSFMAIFAEPSTAVSKAIEIQSKIKSLSKERETEAELFIRIGIHMGQISVEEELAPDIFGDHVNRASRIESLAEGGQVLLSKSVYENARTWLIGVKNKEYRFMKHGTVKLKGIADRIILYEVVGTSATKFRTPEPIKKRLRKMVSIGALAGIVVMGGLAFLINRALKYPAREERTKSAEFAPIIHAPNQTVLAVCYFENNSVVDKEKLDPLTKGLADMLITDLSKVGRLMVLSRGKLQHFADKMGLNPVGKLDEVCVQKIGETFGIDAIVSGSFTGMGEKIRIDVKIIDVKSGKIMRSVEHIGELNNLYHVEKSLAKKVTKELGIALTEYDKIGLAKAETKETGAILHNAKGLDYYDKKMYAEAIQEFKKAVELDPNFERARLNLHICYVIEGEIKKALTEFIELAKRRKSNILNFYKFIFKKLIWK